MMTTGNIAKILGLALEGDPFREISGVADLENADPAQVAYVESAKHLDRAKATHAGCLIAPAELKLEEMAVLRSSHPKYDFARLAKILCPERRPPTGIHPTAIVHESVQLGPDVSVGPYCVLEQGTIVGARTCLSATCYIAPDCRLGEDVTLAARVALYGRVQLGSRVTVHSGAVIGADGFGYVLHQGKYTKFPQLGGVQIGDDVEIGSNVTIDRGALGFTQIGSGTKIDNLVHVAHNVVIEEDCVIAAQTGISGSARIEHHAVIAGQVGIADHVRIEEHACIGAQAGIPSGKIIRKGDFVWGTPARSMEVFKAQFGNLSRLPHLRKEVAQLKKKIAEWEATQE